MKAPNDHQLALQLRDEGAARAEEHADAVHGAWSIVALNAVRRFVYAAPLVLPPEFTTEDVREWAVWVPEPPDRRAWGAVMMKAARSGWIRKHGYRKHKDPARHAGVSTVWRRA